MRLALPLLLLVAAAFLGPSAPPSVCVGPANEGPSAFAVLDRRAPSDSLATLTVCLLSDTARLHVAGYHGELALSRSSKVVRVDRPAGGTRIENTTVPGRVSFAGVAAAGLTPGPVLSLVIAQRRGPDDARIRLTMLDVTDINGRDVVAQVRVDSMPRTARKQ